MVITKLKDIPKEFRPVWQSCWKLGTLKYKCVAIIFGYYILLKVR